MYSPANRVFSFSKSSSSAGGIILIMCTQCTLQHFLHAMYFRCYNNYMIEENDKLFYFLSPNILLFVFEICNFLIKCFIFPQKFCVVYLVIK